MEIRGCLVVRCILQLSPLKMLQVALSTDPEQVCLVCDGCRRRYAYFIPIFRLNPAQSAIICCLVRSYGNKVWYGFVKVHCIILIDFVKLKPVRGWKMSSAFVSPYLLLVDVNVFFSCTNKNVTARRSWRPRQDDTLRVYAFNVLRIRPSPNCILDCDLSVLQDSNRLATFSWLKAVFLPLRYIQEALVNVRHVSARTP